MTVLSSGSTRHSSRYSPADCRLQDLEAVLAQPLDLADHPHAAEVAQGVLLYDGDSLRGCLRSPAERRSVADELARALSDGPGLVVLRGAFADTEVVDQASALFTAMIDAQHASGAVAGDHFAKPGANDRVWNTLEKLAHARPDVFVTYYANELLALACEAWLGPYYQVTSTVNVVNPGGAAQTGHRDYHLGFVSTEVAAEFPALAHRLSPALTLQGAVAHCDMPVETGPTTYLPGSQRYERGYLAWRQPEFLAYYEEHKVQLPLQKGDAVFFNPALFHAAGHNRSAATKRMANLLQISSAFGRAMESVDREGMCNVVYPALRALRAGGASAGELAAVVAATAEGYAFPTNLDLDQPVGGLVPDTQAVLLSRAIAEDWAPETLRAHLADHSAKRVTAAS